MDCKTLHNTKEAFIASRLFSIYCILFEKGTKSNNYEKTVCDYIRSNYMSKICIEDLANSIGLDRRYLSRVFKQKTGITIQQYLIKTRMEHAAALLNSDFPIAQTAAMCGYEDPFLFSRMFKKYFGVSPSHFQKYCWQKTKIDSMFFHIIQETCNFDLFLRKYALFMLCFMKYVKMCWRKLANMVL